MRVRGYSAVVTILAIGHFVGATLTPKAPWPNGPLSTSGRWITDAAGAVVTYAGVNWSGSLETMIPEGLQYQSIESIVSKVKSLGMNAIRLTYATEMVDQYFDNGNTDIAIKTAFTDALGSDDGTAVFNRVVANNPSFGESTTRLQVYDAIAEECTKQQMYLHLDNHVSAAGWCCTPFDGNSWWGDEHFDIDKWERGLSFMADHGRTWPSLVSMSLRNELRIPLTGTESVINSYNWDNWYTNVISGADAIHASNPDVLVFLSGLDSDKDLSPVVQGISLGPGSRTFSRAAFEGYGNKLVLELHAYDNILSPGSGNCSQVNERLLQAGFDGLRDSTANQFPVVLTEFGSVHDPGIPQDPYPSCVLDFLKAQKAGWTIWTITGSYYIREGTRDYDENWGLLAHGWSSCRSSDFVTNALVAAINTTLATNGQTLSSNDDPYQDSSNGNDTPGNSPNGSSQENPEEQSLAASPLHSASRLIFILLVYLLVSTFMAISS